MYAQATDGRKVGMLHSCVMVPSVMTDSFWIQTNNRKFSTCSATSMRVVLNARASRCFDDSASYCGNGIVEPGEPCDCGSTCDEDDRCTPECTVPADKQCSLQNPLVSPCCTEACMFTTIRRSGRSAATECTLDSVRDGTQAGVRQP